MRFRLGDQVAVIDEPVKGRITAIQDGMVTVETTDGFSVKFSSTELVVIKEDLGKLSRYSDLSNESLWYKDHKTVRPKKPLFKSERNKQTNGPMEVDLHIEKLVKSTKRMDTYDILNTQISTARRMLEMALSKRIPAVVFIHGVGAGVLKTELTFLFKNYPVRWEAASFRKYGLGATLVTIVQNPRN
jgi:hypothetical protein